MGLFDFLKPKEKNAIEVSIKVKNTINRSVNSYSVKDERKAECPSCHGILSKIPGSKTKCHHCGEYMFIRTRPQDSVRLVVNEDQADKIDEDWRILNGTQELYLQEQKRFDDRKEALRKKFNGKEPSENDVYWGLFNEDLIKNAVKGQWGLYRNTKMHRADLLLKEEKLKQSLQTYFEVCYLDLNGTENMMLDENGNMYVNPYYDAKPFDLTLKFLAPGIIDTIRKIIKKLNIDKKEVEDIYIKISSLTQKSINTPCNPADTFNELEKEIWN